MKLSTHLGRDRFAWMQPRLTRRDHAVLLVRVAGEAPADAPPRPERRPSHLVVVLDRSGSMSGDRLEQSKAALVDVVRRLGASDSFGLVTFDSSVRVVVPAGPVSDSDAVVRQIQAVRAGGSTDLGAGLVRGLEEARRLDVGPGVRVLLVSDGHANTGVTDPDALRGRVERVRADGVTTSTLGVGLGYDEQLLSVIARAGAGNEHFAEESDTAAAAIGEECGELAQQRFLSCRLTFTPSSGIRRAELLNDLPRTSTGDGFQVDLGGLRVDETRSLVIECAPHQATRPGRRRVGVVRLDWVLADDLTDHSVSTTVWTRVIRPGEPEGVVDREVVGEWFVQRMLRRKRRAVQALAAGRFREAEEWFARVAELARDAAPGVPRRYREELLRAAEEADHFAEVAPLEYDVDGRSHALKSMTVDIARRARRRS